MIEKCTLIFRTLHGCLKKVKMCELCEINTTGMVPLFMIHNIKFIHTASTRELLIFVEI